MAYSGGDEFPCVVGEVGSYATKMGFAGEDYPRSYFRSTTAVPKPSSNVTANSSTDNRFMKQSHDFFTAPLNQKDGNDDGWEICNPVELSTGLIYEGTSSTTSNSSAPPSSKNDAPPPPSSPSSHNSPSSPTAECYQQFSTHLSHGYTSALNVDPTTTPLLLVEKSYNPPPIRQKMLELIMEEQGNPAAFFARDAVCACYAVGRTSATVMDIGYHGTIVTPVFDGYVETKGILRSPIGTKVLDEQI